MFELFRAWTCRLSRHFTTYDYYSDHSCVADNPTMWLPTWFLWGMWQVCGPTWRCSQTLHAEGEMWSFHCWSYSGLGLIIGVHYRIGAFLGGGKHDIVLTPSNLLFVFSVLGVCVCARVCVVCLCASVCVCAVCVCVCTRVCCLCASVCVCVVCVCVCVCVHTHMCGCVYCLFVCVQVCVCAVCVWVCVCVSVWVCVLFLYIYVCVCVLLKVDYAGHFTHLKTATNAFLAFCQLQINLFL